MNELTGIAGEGVRLHLLHHQAADVWMTVPLHRHFMTCRVRL